MSPTVSNAGETRVYNDIHRFFDLSLDLLAIVGTDGYFKRLNPAWERVLGYSNEELLANPAISFVHPDDVPAAQATGKRDRAKFPTVMNFTNRYRHRDGNYIWLEWTAQYYPKEDLSYCVARDITARKAAEDALRQSEQTTRQLLNATQNSAFLINANSEVVALNEAAAAEVFQRPVSEVLGKSIYDVTHPEWAKAGRPRIETVMKTAEPMRFSTQYQNSFADVTHSPIFDEQGNVSGIATFVHNITHLKQTEVALRKSEEQFRKILEAATEGIFLANAKGEIVLTNPRLNEDFGYLRDELLGKSVDILIPEMLHDYHDTQPLLYDASVLELRSGSSLEVLGKRKDGSTFPVEISMSYVETDHELQLMALISDITERKKIEQIRLETERMQADVENQKVLVEVRQQFTSMVSHEFRTPLTAIATTCEILERYHDRMDEEKRLERIRGLNAQVLTMLNLLDDMLALNKIQAGITEFHPSPLDLVALCRRVIETVQLADRGQHPLKLNLDYNPPVVYADSHLLEHALINLLSNAMKYSPANNPVELSLSSYDHHVCFEVRDYGRGIPEAEKPRMFEAFFRAKNSRDISGTGLGLVVVKHNIELHGGTITFDSTENEGTTFWVNLPVGNTA